MARDEVAALPERGGEFYDEEYDIESGALVSDSDSDEDFDEPEPHEVRAGGAIRRNGDGDEFWLNLDQLREFNRMDRSFPTTKEGNNQFNDWFDAAITKWGKKSVGRRTGRGLWGGDGGWKPSWSGSGSWASSKKWMSDWWGGDKLFGGLKSDKTRKLAVALQVVQTWVRAIDSHTRKFRVTLAQEEEKGAPSSFTAYDERLIQVSPMALLDEGIEEGEGIDVTTGFALHEASHVEHSEGTLAAMRQPSVLRPVAVVGLLHNVLEDVRIEALTAENFPGFAGYFEKALAYIWTLQKLHLPAKWGPTLKDKLNAVIAACKWYANYKVEIKDGVLLAEVEWWHNWVGRYQDNKMTMREALIEGLERLQEDEKTKEEMEKMAGEEEAMEKAIGSAMKPENLKRLIQESLKRHGLDKMPACFSGEHGGGVHDPSGKRKPAVGAAERNEVERLVKNEIEEGKIEDFKIPKASGANPVLTVLHPPETAQSKSKHKVANPSLVARMRHAFFFRPSAMEDTSKLLKSGSIDDDELWRAGVGDYRLFQQRTIEETPDTSISMLIDVSGSMRGYSLYGLPDRNSKISQAIEMAQIMLACLKDMNGVRARVRAHTGDTVDAGGGSKGGAALYRIWERGEPESRIALMHEIQNGNNYDGFAIGWCVRELVQNGRPNEHKVLIVLSDGHPAGSQYGGEPAYRHVRETVAWAERQGVDVIQIAIDHAMDAQRQAQMFKHWVPFETAEKLPAQLTMLLRKIFPTR